MPPATPVPESSGAQEPVGAAAQWATSSAFSSLAGTVVSCSGSATLDGRLPRLYNLQLGGSR
jgi:hypothetical protein